MRTTHLFLLIAAFFASAVTQSLRAQDSGASTAISDDYILQPLDLLQVRVFQEEDMDRELRISRESVVSLPLIGRVNLKGLTIRAAEQKIEELYDRDYLVNPQVNIVVMEYARRTVNVLGSVGSPGEIEFPREEGLNLLDAISRAGGFTRLADRRKIRLTRKNDDGSQENFVINADDMIEGDSNEVWVLQTDDLIYVPERLL
ncbi:polysaccharide biosynthesis/export family protein [Actomonas aquatica]|uniref:Polysaccharide biosynthesis/export family protein n=1 Tax=Actomonas aquatica TaxID=2866162 RepID=A0ABZ1C719_9BACT|nr:polysaccharide biosynthesis/export family protein [Opitutus sp. WL0086]WRQ87170.1 polysaccharide biosynthesis/export family protein [Opitutus sp. WL0086]